MGITRSDIPGLLTPVLKTAFFESYQPLEAGSDFMKVATTVPSQTTAESYAWLGSVPKMREFVDERKLKSIVEYNYSIPNKTYEASIGVDRAAIEDDQFGQIRIRINGMAIEAARFKDELTFTALQDGFTALAYDGLTFFHATRTIGESGTIDNKMTDALTTAALQTAITTMRQFKDDRGRPMGANPDTLVVGTSLEFVALAILTSIVYTSTDGGANTSNVMKGRLNLIVSPYVNANDWFVLDTKSAVKPLIYQDRIPVTFEAMEANSESGFMRDQYAYGVRMRGAVGYGLPQHCIGSLVAD